MQDSENQIRSFIVLMDKNKDTQWLEDGKFVGNPLVFQKPKSKVSLIDALAVLTGSEYVNDYTATHDCLSSVYKVDGIRRSGESMKQHQVRVIIQYK